MHITIFFKTDLNILKYVTERGNMKCTREYKIWITDIGIIKNSLLYIQGVN